MNCEELKNQWLADPHNLNAESKQHLMECLACQEFNRKGLQREAKLNGAFNVPTDNELNTRVLAATAAQQASRPARGKLLKRWLPMAAAACLAVVVGVQMRSAPDATGSQAFAAEMLAHIEHEPEALNAVATLPVDNINGVIRHVGLELEGSSDQMVYATICPLYGHAGDNVVHLVVQSEMGPVTVLIATSKDPKNIADSYGDYQFASVEFFGGSAILAAQNREALKMVERKLRLQLEPSTTV